MHNLALIFPDLALITLGWALYRWTRWSPAFWEGMEKLVYYVLFPAMLFISVVRSPASVSESAAMVAAAMGALATGVALGYAARWVLRPQPALFASGVQCAFRFNSYILLALSMRFGGEAGVGLAALIVGFVVPVANFFSVLPLARHAGTGLLRELARNPLVIATVGGLAVKLLGIPIPEPVAATLTRLGQASLGIGLLCVGAGLRLEADPDHSPTRVRDSRRLAVWFTATKLALMPAAAYVIAQALGAPALARAVAVVFAAMPTSPAAYVLATRMGGDGRFVAMLISVSVLLAALTLPGWLALVAP